MEQTGDTTQFSTLDQQTDPRFFIHYLDARNALADVKRLKQVMQAQLELARIIHESQTRPWDSLPNVL